MDLIAVEEREQGHAHFLDLDMQAEPISLRGHYTTYKVEFRPYRKPGNAYAYIPFNSFHGRHVFSRLDHRGDTQTLDSQ